MPAGKPKSPKKTFIAVRWRIDLRQQLKIAAARENSTMQKYLEGCFSYVESRGGLALLNAPPRGK